MAHRQKHYTGRQQQRRFARDRYYLSVEGSVTEVEYFKLVQRLLKQTGSRKREFSIKIIHPTKIGRSAPSQVLNRMKQQLGRTKLTNRDHAWVIVDRNDWPEAMLRSLENWSTTDSRYHFALSNPNFGYWLLLHFEKGTAIKFKRDCKTRLRKFLKDYDKGIDSGKFSLKEIESAVKNAKSGGYKNTAFILKNIGSTSINRLMEELLGKYK